MKKKIYFNHYNNSRINTIRNLFLHFLLLLAGISFSQQSFTFTPCGATGAAGPTQLQVNSTYSTGNSLNGSVTILVQGIQQFTVPTTGIWIIETRGARGYNPGGDGGRGAIMRGEFSLTAGNVLKIAVGQEGQVNPAAGTLQYGGGGGSFVSLLNNTPLCIAGGGGGSHVTSYAASSADGTVSTSGNTGAGSTSGTGGTGGAGGLASSSANGGAGFTGDGGGTTGPALSFTNGAEGGNVNAVAYANGGIGGFGGGGGTQSWNNNRGGGGGGYSGGGGGQLGQPSCWGGGGGSFNSGTNQLNLSGANTFSNGLVILTEACSINITTLPSNTLNPSICSGQSLTLTTNAVSNFSWSTGQTTSSIVVAPTTNTVYSLSGTSSLACTASASKSITVSSSLPVLSISNPSNNICLGKSTTLTASGGVTYTWTGGIQNGLAFTPSATQSYTVTGQNGCGISTASTTVTVAPLSVSVSATPTLVCEGGTAVVSASSAVNGYTWLPVSLYTASTVVSPTALTVYTVTASDGTCSGVATVTVTTKTTPTVTAAGSSATVCENGTVTITAGGAQNYSWTPVNLTGQSIVVTPTISTLYNVAGTNSLGCTAYNSWVVVVSPAPPTSALSSKPVVCVGQQAVLYASGANSYVWINGPSTPVYSVNPLVNTLYTVTGTGQNGCTKNATVSVAVYDPTLTVTSSAPGTCPGGNVNLTASTPGATTYSWNGSSGFSTFGVSPTVTTIYTVSANSSSIIICNVNNTIAVIVYANPVVSIAATKTTMCKGEPVAVLTASGGTSYLWAHNNATTTSVNAPSNNVSTITYSVTGTNTNGCQGGISVQVKVDACTGIDKAQKSTTLLVVYPNPNEGEFTISNFSDVDLKLVNELGQVIKLISLNNSNNHEAVVKDISAGVYFIVGQKDNITFNQKIVVTH